MNRKESMDEWIAKGAEWIAKQLWIARKQNKELREERNKDYFCKRGDDAEKRQLQNENSQMARVIKEYGIKPIPVVIEYRDTHCKFRDVDDFECLDFGDCDDCEHYMTEQCVKTFYLYSFSANDGDFSGITANFGEVNLDVVQIRDTRNGNILYENKGGGE